MSAPEQKIQAPKIENGMDTIKNKIIINTSYGGYTVSKTLLDMLMQVFPEKSQKEIEEISGDRQNKAMIELVEFMNANNIPNCGGIFNMQSDLSVVDLIYSHLDSAEVSYQIDDYDGAEYITFLPETLFHWHYVDIINLNLSPELTMEKLRKIEQEIFSLKNTEIY